MACSPAPIRGDVHLLQTPRGPFPFDHQVDELQRKREPLRRQTRRGSTTQFADDAIDHRGINPDV